MVDPVNKPFFPATPVFLLDKKIASFEQVLGYNMTNIRQIDFFNTRETLELFGQLGANGVVIIHTKLPEPYNQSITFTVPGLQPEVRYPVEVNPNRDPRTPALGPSVYWNPSIQTDENGKTTISFYHHDEVGQFQVNLFGRGSNGKWYQNSTLYEVKP